MNSDSPTSPPPHRPTTDKRILKAIKKYGGSESDLWAFSTLGTFVRFDGQTVHIERSGLDRLTVGKGAKRIPVHSISAMQIKKPGIAVSGYLQFTLGGGNESRSRFGRQTMAAVEDENSVMIGSKQDLPAFEALRDAIEVVINARFVSPPPPPSPAPEAAAPDPMQQLMQLAQLHEAGILTDDEFSAKKADILKRM